MYLKIIYTCKESWAFLINWLPEMLVDLSKRLSYTKSGNAKHWTLERFIFTINQNNPWMGIILIWAPREFKGYENP